MATEQKPMPRAWYSAGGNDKLWGRHGTYCSVPYDALPPLPTRAEPGLAWIRAMPVPKPLVGLHTLDTASGGMDTGQRIDKLAGEAKELGLTLPSTFREFMTDPGLHGQVPSCTACYLELSDRLIALPGGGPGRLLRFMNDQQCVLLWYLHLLPDGQHVVVCGSPYSELEDSSLDENIVELNGVVCAPSFEDFVHRFWLENILWFAMVDSGRELSEEERAYVDFAQRSRPKE